MCYTTQMVYKVHIEAVHCVACGGLNAKKNGTTDNGKQQYVCKDCKRSFQDDPQPNGYFPERREEILRAHQERSSLQGPTRILGVARNTVSHWLKKALNKDFITHHLRIPPPDLKPTLE